jgi:hypothetical protein
MKLFVAVGNDPDDEQSTIQHSTDGKTWTKATSGGFAMLVARRGVQPSAQALGGGRDADDDEQSTIQHSTDGKDWTKATSGGFSGVSLGWIRRGVQPSAQAVGGGRGGR